MASTPLLATVEACFSESYEEARQKFLQAATKLPSKELHSYQVFEDEFGQYHTDIVVIRGKGKGLLVSSSGTHGVEGYAGSAIQIRLLEQLKTEALAPTVVLVHAVNPFGMAHFRRCNENNVDLNRNALQPQDFKRLVESDTLQASYTKFDPLFNPTQPPGWFEIHIGIWIRMVYNIVKFGLLSLKTAAVAATYTQKKGLFYGGQELQASHRLLKDFMSKHFGEVPASHVAWLDIHTGLGPCGVDVFLGSPEDEVSNLFPKIPGHCDGFQAGFGGKVDDIIEARCRGQLQTKSGPVTQAAGYEFSVGILNASWVQHFFKKDSGRSLVLAQEFGTHSNIRVFRALMLENVGYHHDRQNHNHWRTFTRDAFYVRTADWKRRVVARGTDAFYKLADHLKAAAI